jgi:HD-like signal output (HDOD) protein
VNLEEKCYADLLADLENNRLVLPTLPEVAFKIKEVVEDENATAGRIADTIGTDPGLTARLLKVVNSPLYRGRSQIDNVQHAVTRLGMTIVRNLVLSLVIKQLFAPKSKVTEARLKKLWEHSTQVASISHVLASQFTRLSPEQAMLAGLIHDLGTMPILAYAEKVPELLKDEELLDKLIADLHPRVGKAILEAWKFPKELVAVVSEHENLARDSGPEIDYVDVVIVANLQSYLGTDHPHAGVDPAAVPAFAKLGLDTEVDVISMEGAADSIDAVQRMLAE